MGFKLEEGKGLPEGWDSKELWKSFEKAKAAKGSQLKVQEALGADGNFSNSLLRTG